MFRNILFLSFVFSLIGSKTIAFPMPIAGSQYLSQHQVANANYHFDGIVAFSNCSGSLIQIEGSVATDNAIVLTNGHCYEEGMPRPGEFVSHKASRRNIALLDDRSNKMGTLHATEVIYATMTSTDIALYRVKETYQEIERTWGAHPLNLSSKHPAAGTSIDIVSGYWQRGYSCKIDGFANQLSEDGWMMRDSIRYSQPGCEIIGGTSGSPVIEAGTHNVIGINNTINESGHKCSRNNPCEIDKDGNVTYEKGLGYGQQTYWIYSCINTKHEFDLTTPGCVLLH